MSEAYLGIDLGTTNSCVCYWNKATQSTETIVNELGKSTTPSWVSFEADGKVTVGERAQHK
jgi:molecular chaperone DnaK